MENKKVIKLDQLKAKFKKAVIAYRHEIISSFHSRHGDKDYAEEKKKKVVNLFREFAKSKSIKEGLLYIALRDLFKPVQYSDSETIRLNNNLHELAYDLNKELEAI